MEPARDRHSPARRAVCLRQRALECSRREREGGPRYLDELPAAWHPGGVAVALVHESLLTCPGRENRLARLGGRDCDRAKSNRKLQDRAPPPRKTCRPSGKPTTFRCMTRRLTQVAAYAKVSEATVSRVLNGKPGVAEATRQAVLTALDVLGYERPTQLRGQRARLAGLVLPELQNPIFPAFAEVIGGALAQRGFTPVLCTRTTGGLSEADYVGMLLDQHVSGFVFAGGHCGEANAPHEHYRLLRSRGIPAVLLHAAVDDLAFPVVSTDDMTATGQAYDHLASLGHRRIGLVVGPADHVPSRRKLAGFIERVRLAAGVAPIGTVPAETGP